ncbi:ABC transporter ATP-binding protein [Rhodovastum atsumiense]|uniref:ABC transporter ATP-binding protein n=1 Tax=Rhodovastum atsumiense TaxID=504468 RepID=UPI00139F29BE|nr:ATP-binding cassette domain-containing protein [Rhodovastum atsumiense]
MLEVELSGLRRGFVRPDGAPVQVLDGLDLVIAPGEFHAILGYSGCGKTTLLRLIAGLDRPDGGRVTFRPAPPGGAWPRLGMVFQEHLLLPWASVAENLRLALRRFRLSRPEEDRRIAAVLALVGLDDCARLRPGQLSGGMAQRVALARALMREPELLLMDEPLGALDALTRRQMQDEIARLRGRVAPTTVLVTHDFAEAVRLADRVSVLAGGRIAASVLVRSPPGGPPLGPDVAGRIEALVLESLARATRGAAPPPARTLSEQIGEPER